MKTYLAEKQQLDTQNQILSEINSKIAEINLSNIDFGIVDFVYDDITITSGGLDSIERRITT